MGGHSLGALAEEHGVVRDAPDELVGDRAQRPIIVGDQAGAVEVLPALDLHHAQVVPSLRPEPPPGCRLEVLRRQSVMHALAARGAPQRDMSEVVVPGREPGRTSSRAWMLYELPRGEKAAQRLKTMMPMPTSPQTTMNALNLCIVVKPTTRMAMPTTVPNIPAGLLGLTLYLFTATRSGRQLERQVEA